MAPLCRVIDSLYISMVGAVSPPLEIYIERTRHVTTLLLTRRQEPFYQQIKYIKEHGLTFIYLKKCVDEMGESPLILLILHPVCWPL